jgi:RimJ/RimL family protein N-acetyltransferase
MVRMSDNADAETSIATDRLRLVVATIEMLTAEFESNEQFCRIVGAELPSNWPPALYDQGAAEYTIARLKESPASSNWWMRYIVLDCADLARTVIGTVGFKGPPSSDGIVEIGYGLLRQFQKQGYATEAVAGMIAWAFQHADVRAVRAQTLPNLVASIAVMKRNGFEFMCESEEDGLQTVVYELPRETWGQRHR